MIQIENAPHIDGLVFRHYQGERDYAPLAAVLTASEAADHVERTVNAEDIGKALQHMSNCDAYRDMLMAEISGEIVGYVRGWWTEGPLSSRTYSHIGFLVPQWRRRGIGQAMLAWIEARLSEIAVAHPSESDKYFQVSVSQHKTGTAIMLEHSGYSPVRYYFEMVRPTQDDIVEYPLPEGLELRSAEPGHYRAIWAVVCETSQDEWGHKELTEEDYQEWLASPLFQPELWQVAWDASTNRVSGHVLTYIHYDENKQFDRKRGYTESIGVTRAWRRRGVARALISRSLHAQKAAGMTESALVVDSDNPNEATRLYESCGFQVVKKDTLYRKPMVFPAIDFDNNAVP
ncbi:MAG TPA: GNAT family N-acetyltransferase [Anaerolineales bacterium]